MHTISMNQIVDELGQLDRQSDLVRQTIGISQQWWSAHLAEAGFTSIASKFTTASICRQDLFSSAPRDLSNRELVLEFAFRVIAWGSGTSPRNNIRRLGSLRNLQAQEQLLRGLELASVGDFESFHMFQSKGRNNIPFLGPAFFSKIMYFAGSGQSQHPLLIIDQRVLNTLKDTSYAGSLKKVANFGPNTYFNACNALLDIAQTAQAEGVTHCTPDLVEFWAFKRNGNLN